MQLKAPLFILVISVCCGLDFTTGDVATSGPAQTGNIERSTTTNKPSSHTTATLITTISNSTSTKPAPSKSTATSSPRTSSTTHAPTTAHPTTHAPTTPHSTTHAPTAPHSTTTTPHPTTPAPTTPHPTTPAPTTPHPTTPAPTPAPKTGDWALNYTSSSVCMRLVSEIKFHVSYSKGNETGQETLSVPTNATVTGNCSGLMDLDWDLKFLNQTGLGCAQFVFSSNNQTKEWKLLNVSVKISGANSTIDFITNKTDSVSAPDGSSYLCSKSNSYNLTSHLDTFNNVNITMAVLTFEDLQVEAFKPNKTDNKGFGNAHNCVQQLTPDVVPIVVGCALAALVVIVLVAYLFAQRRPPAQGYRSV